MLLVINHEHQPLEEWRQGVMTRMRVSMLTGGRQLCIFEQFCESGAGAPDHFHTVEEVLEVIDGTAEIQLGNESAILTTNQSVVIPAGMKHGFRNPEKSRLHVRATLAAHFFEAVYGTGMISRKWLLEADTGLVERGTPAARSFGDLAASRKEGH